jgi:hypothetical protein
MSIVSSVCSHCEAGYGVRIVVDARPLCRRFMSGARHRPGTRLAASGQRAA